MKKLSAIILSPVIAFSVTACSSGNNEESKPLITNGLYNSRYQFFG